MGDMSEKRHFSEILLVLGEFDVTIHGKLTDLRRGHFKDNEILGWFDEMDVYQIREGGKEFFGTLEYNVLANHMATVLLEQSVDEFMDESGEIDLENGLNYVQYID